jgi:2-keto-4-pentenoate hydratase/2-oxohepta-3-ene-1,7-dioic acid hydratase in catechol pathway
MNDVSARDWQFRTSQWFIGKTFDTFAPIGPAVVTADEVGDPHVLDLSLRLNGKEMQRSNTRHLIFGVPALVAELSRVMTLEPGDVIATGTPGGVGFIRKPPVFLKPGDQVEISIARIGSLVNPVVAEGRA